MAKVILITSREFRNSGIWTEISNYKPITVQNSSIDERYGYFSPFFEGLFPVIWKLDKEELRRNAIKNKDDAELLKSNVKELILPKVKNKGGSSFVFGIYTKKLHTSSNGNLVYFANEFPWDSFGCNATSENKYRYLNAILDEICSDNSISDVTNVEWEIISHDCDWKNGKSNCWLNDEHDFGQIKADIDSTDYPVLSPIINASSTRIRLFQHDIRNDHGYMYVKRMMSEPNYFEDCSSFMCNTLQNIKLFEKYQNPPNDREAKLEEFISNVDPNYGFFPTKL